jgi:hypothetical protein
MTKAVDPVADLRAEERSIARRKAEHDAVHLERAKALLDQIQSASAELGGLADLILTPFVGAHLIALKLDVERGQMAVAAGQAAVAATLAEG